MIKKISPFILGFIMIFSIPMITLAAGKLVPECNVVVNGQITKPCNFDYLLTLINNIITFLLVTLATPLFALIIMYTGWLYLGSGGSSEKVTKAKHIFKNALIGYVIALAAWLIVKSILLAVGFDGTMFLG